MSETLRPPQKLRHGFRTIGTGGLAAVLFSVSACSLSEQEAAPEQSDAIAESTTTVAPATERPILSPYPKLPYMDKSDIPDDSMVSPRWSWATGRYVNCRQPVVDSPDKLPESGKWVTEASPQFFALPKHSSWESNGGPIPSARFGIVSLDYGGDFVFDTALEIIPSEDRKTFDLYLSTGRIEDELGYDPDYDKLVYTYFDSFNPGKDGEGLLGASKSFSIEDATLSLEVMSKKDYDERLDALLGADRAHREPSDDDYTVVGAFLSCDTNLSSAPTEVRP